MTKNSKTKFKVNMTGCDWLWSFEDKGNRMRANNFNQMELFCTDDVDMDLTKVKGEKKKDLEFELSIV